MMGLSRAITAVALAPRRARISLRSRSRIRLSAALLGLISSLSDCRRTVNPRKSKPSSRETMRVLSSLKVRPLGASHPASRALTCCASSLVWHKATRSSAYLINTGEPETVSPACVPVTWYRTPAACSIPCRAIFRSNGLTTPPTQLAIGPCFALRVGFGAGVGAVGGVASDRDGVSDRDLVGADEDVFDEQAQDSLAFFDGRSAGLGAQSGEEAFEVVGEFEVDLPVGELAVEGVDLLAQAGLSGPQLRHPGTEFVEGDQLFLEGADESGDRRGRLGQSGVETLALGGGGVRGADLLESLVDLGPDQGRVGEQAADVVPDDGVEVVGADRLVGADPAVLIAVVIRAEAAVVVDLLVGGAGRRAVVGVSAAAAGADALQQRGIAAVARGVALVVRQPLLGPGPGVSVDECRDRYLQPLLAGPLGHGVAVGRGAPGDPSCPVQPGRRLGAHRLAETGAAGVCGVAQHRP